MKRNSVTLGILFSLLLFFSLTATAAETYQLDNKHSYVAWQANHFGFSNPSGKWLVNGTLLLDEAKPQNSKIDVVIQVAELFTGISEFDTHLKGKLFLDTDKFPTATFVSDKITVTGKSTAKVRGILTLHGVSKPITLDVKLNKLGDNPISNKKTAGFSAHTTLKRSDFDITALVPGVSDQVKINIEAEAFKA